MDDDEHPTNPTDIDNTDDAPESAGPSSEKNITLDDIFGGDSELDENENLVLSDSDDEKVVAPVLPKFKKKQRADGEEQPIEKRTKKKSRKRAADDEGQQEGEGEKAKVKNEFDEALDRIKSKRFKKIDGEDTAFDEMIINLVEKMKESANADHEFNKLHQPAVAKIKMLPKVVNLLAKVQLYDQMLDNHILSAIKAWLEPLPDGSLPNLDVQMAMFNALAKLPINTEHLSESLVGRVVMFYSKCDRTTPTASKVVEALLVKWMRPILGRSQNYKERSLKTVSFDASEIKRKKVDLDANTNNLEKFTRVPKPLQQEFKVMPQSNFGARFEPEKDNSPNKAKKMKNMLQNFKSKRR